METVTGEQEARAPMHPPVTPPPVSDERLSASIMGALGEKGRAQQMHALYQIAANFHTADFPRALALLASANTEEARGLRHAFAAFWLESDLPAARAWLSALPAAERASIFPGVVGTWARLDGVDLRDWLRSFPPEEAAGLTAKARREVATALVKVNPDMALEFLLSTRPAENTGIQEEWPPPEYWAFLEWGELDPAAAGARLLELPTEFRERCLNGLIESWVIHDPAAAEAWIDALTDAPLVAQAVRVYVMNLAPRDPATAAAFTLRHWMPQSEEDGIAMISNVVAALVEKDEAAALAWVKSFPDEERREQGLYTFLNRVSSEDPKHAVDLWMAEYGGRNDSSGWASARYLARNLVTHDGFSAGAAFVAQIPEIKRSEVVRPFIQALTQGWSSLGPVETAEAVLQEKVDPFRAELLRPVFEELAFSGELAEAQRLGTSLPPGLQRDAAVTGFLEGQLKRDPDAALRFLTAVDSTPAGRELLLQSVAASLRDAKSPVRPWVEETRLLSPAEKQRILTLQKEVK